MSLAKECCDKITLVFLFLNFNLKFFLKNRATMRGVPSSLSTTRVTNEYMIALHHTSRKYVGTSLKY